MFIGGELYIHPELATSAAARSFNVHCHGIVEGRKGVVVEADPLREVWHRTLSKRDLRGSCDVRRITRLWAARKPRSRLPRFSPVAFYISRRVSRPLLQEDPERLAALFSESDLGNIGAEDRYRERVFAFRTVASPFEHRC
jgi:hypothetical protein